MRLVFYYRQTLAVWFVADSEVIIYQGTMRLIRGKSLKQALRRQLTDSENTYPHLVVVEMRF